MNCGFKLPDGVKFCYECGHKQAVTEDGGRSPPSMSKHAVEAARIKAEQEKESMQELHDFSTLHDVGREVAKREALPRDLRQYTEDRSTAKVAVFTGDRSTGKRYCSNCDMEIGKENRPLKCSQCGSRFCEHCEGWYRSAERARGERPLCEKHYLENKMKIERERREREEQERRESAQREADRKRLEEERRKAVPPPPPKELSNSIGMKFVKIPKRNYYMGKNQVTQKEWKAVMGSNPSHFKGDELPVEQVSWDDCQEYVERLNHKEGTYRYRLPTEEEWEHACRAGSTGKYCFGDDVRQLGNYAWYEDNSGSKTHFVGTKRPNKWGLHDMHGNVWEWCQDKWDESGSGRVVRGGSWGSFADFCRSADRYVSYPGDSGSSIGLRLVRLQASREAL